MRRTAFIFLLLLTGAFLTQASAQAVVSGRVSSSDGASLRGVSINVKGTERGGISGENGRYSISAEKGEVLVFSYLGFLPKEEIVGDQGILNVILVPKSEELNSVVITALGISREKKSLGYSVGEIKGDEMDKVPQQNILNALTGKVAGLSITNTNNMLSSNPQVVIRGAISLSGNNTPLIVVDGLATGKDPGVLGDLSADNIASITVLKGPSASALYGSRAGSGALIITTKNGRGFEKGIGISVNSSFVSAVPYHYLPLQQQFAGGVNGIFDPNSLQQRWGPPMGTPEIQWNSNGEAVPLEGHPDNYKNFSRRGDNFINDVNIYGSNEAGSFNLSLSDTRATGNFPGSSLRKDAVSFAAVRNVAKTLKVSANVHILNSGSDNIRTPVTENHPFENKPNESLNYWPNWIDINDFKDYWAVVGEQQNTPSSTFNNPWFVAYVNTEKFKRFRAYGNVKLNWDISEALNLETQVGSYNGYYSTVDQKGKSDRDDPNGWYVYNSAYSQELNTSFLLNYKKRVKDFSFDVSGGGNLLFQSADGGNILGNNLVSPNLYTSSNIDRSAVSYENPVTRKRINSLYGIASIGYKEGIYLQLTGRNDWSSTLPVNNRSYFYPSASLSLVLTELVRLPDFISLLKLRGGLANVGSDTDPYQLQQTLNRYTWGNDNTYSYPLTMANFNLEPENIESKEVGLDLDMFNGRIGLEATYYQVRDEDQIIAVSVPAMTGFQYASLNAGVVRSRGVELVLHGVPIQSKDLKWDVRFNLAKDRSVLSRLPEGVSQFEFWSSTNVSSHAGINGEIGDLWGHDVLRVKDGAYKGWPLLDENGYVQFDPDEKKMGNVNPNFTLGFLSSLSVKRITVSASLDWRDGGNYYSKTMLRLTRGGRQESWYKGEGSSTFTGILSSNSFGGDKDRLAQEIKSHPEKYSGIDGLVWVGGRNKEFGGFPLNTTNIDNGAFFPGVRNDGQGGYVENFGGPNTKYFRAGLIADPGAGWWSQGVQTWLYDASFIKLRELSVTYSFSDKIAKSIRAQSLSLSVFARNLIIWTEAQNYFDPELAYVPNGSGYSSFSKGWDHLNNSPWWIAETGLKLNVQF